MTKHTQGPLTVVVSDEWPFDIVTTAKDGSVKFVTRMPCHSSEDRKAEDAINCRHFKHSEREKYSAINRRAIADEMLRAAAPDLLEALNAIVQYWDEVVPPLYMNEMHKNAKAAIAKANGEIQ